MNNNISGNLYKYKGHIIVLGLAVGVLSRLDFLPNDLLGDVEYTNYLYIGIIALAIFLYLQHHWGKDAAKYRQYVPSRNMTNPEYTRQLYAQRGSVVPPPMPPMTPPPVNSVNSIPGEKVFEAFRRE